MIDGAELADGDAMTKKTTPGPERITVLFVRHGQAYTDPERYDADEQRPLTAVGRNSVAAIAGQVALFAPQRLVCSRSLRAYQTALLLAQTVGLEAEPVAGLQERVFHSLPGLKRAQIAQRFGSAVVRAVDQCSDILELPGEETLPQARQRVCAALGQLLTRAQDRLAIVSHGGPHSWLLTAGLGLPLEQARIFRLDEACFSLLDYQRAGDGFRLQRVLALNTRQLPADLRQQG